MAAGIAPFLNGLLYFLWSKIFRRPSLPNWYRCNKGSGLIAYMLALTTFEVRLMHLVLLASCIGYTLTDKIYFLIFKYAKIEETDTEQPEDAFVSWSAARTIQNAHYFLVSLFVKEPEED